MIEVINQSSRKKPNAALRCERRLAILEQSETAKSCESLLNALLWRYSEAPH